MTSTTTSIVGIVDHRVGVAGEQAVGRSTSRSRDRLRTATLADLEAQAGAGLDGVGLLGRSARPARADVAAAEHADPHDVAAAASLTASEGTRLRPGADDPVARRSPLTPPVLVSGSHLQGAIRVTRRWDAGLSGTTAHTHLGIGVPVLLRRAARREDGDGDPGVACPRTRCSQCSSALRPPRSAGGRRRSRGARPARASAVGARRPRPGGAPCCSCCPSSARRRRSPGWPAGRRRRGRAGTQRLADQQVAALAVLAHDADGRVRSASTAAGEEGLVAAAVEHGPGVVAHAAVDGDVGPDARDVLDGADRVER